MNTIQIKRGTYNRWISTATILGSGELGLDITNNILKIGNGSSTWNNLPIFNTNIDSSFVANTGIFQDLVVNGSGGYIFSANDNLGFDILTIDNNHKVNINGSVGINVVSQTQIPDAKLYVKGSGIFTSGLFIGSIPVSVSGHSHESNNIIDFNSAVSGLLPITNLSAGSGIGITQSGTVFTVATTGTFGLTQTQVDARVNTLISGIYAPLSGATFTGSISGPSGNFTSLKVDNVDVSGLLTSNSGNFTGNLTVGGNLTVNGTTAIVNVETVTIEDPIITLGLASGNVVPFTNFDRGLALIRATGLTAFMGWDTSASQFVMLSSGVASNSSGNYDAGTYGNLQINNLSSSRVYSSRLDLTDGGINNSFISCGAEGDTRFLVSSSGELGIGSAIPSTIDSAPFYISPNGSVTNGTWNASTIAVNKGGTGRTTYSNGQLLIGSGTSLVANTLTATSGIGITNGSGTITIGVTGIPSSTITNFNSSVSGLLTPYQLALTNPVTGVGTSGYLTKWISSSGVGSGVIFDNGTNIGIGTTSPSKKLDVIGDARVSGVLNLVNISDSTDRSISVTSNEMTFASVHGIFGYSIGLRGSRGSACGMESNATNGYLALAAGGSEKVRIATDGKVGIGTSTPSGQLHVVGTGIFSSNLSIGSTATPKTVYISGAIPTQGELLRIQNGSSSTNTYLDIGVGTAGNYDDHVIFYRGTGTGSNTRIFGIDNSNRLLGFVNWAMVGNTTITSYNNANSLIKMQNLTTNDMEISAVSGIIFQSQQSTKMRMDQNGNLGIGTTSPVSPLHVVGSGRFVGSNGNTIIINATNENGAVSIDAPSSLYNDISLRVNSQNIFRGLDGWTATWADSAATTYFQVGRAAGNTIFTSLVGNAFNRLAYSSNKYLFTNQTTNIIVPSNYFNIEYNGTSILSATTGGSVGIGTTTPSGQLHVIGSGIFSSGIRVGDSATNGYVIGPSGNTFIQFNQSSNNTIRLDSNTYSNSHAYLNTQFTTINSQATYCNGSFQFPITNSAATSTATQRDSNPINFFNRMWNGSSETQGKSTIEVKASTATNLLSRLAFSTHIGDGTTTLAERMCINSSNGFVGINTTTPSGHLDVAGDVYVRGTGNNLGTIYFKSQAVGDKALYIGATNGGDLVMNGAGANIQLSSQGGYLNVLGMSTQMHIGHTYDAGNTSQIIRFLPAAREMMRMTTSGTLGIGLPTSASSYAGNSVQLFNQQPYANTRVHIAGSGADSGSAALIVTNSGISPLLYVRNDGNIGIGTTSPSSKLDVNGNVNIDGNLTFDSFTESVISNGNSSSGVILSLTSGTVHTCTLTNNCTFTMPTATAGKSFTMFLNTGSGNYTAAFSGVRWADSATPTATILANKVDIYSFISDGTYWYGSFSQNYG